jgi:uncharacterized cupin superfamily protein
MPIREDSRAKVAKPSQPIAELLFMLFTSGTAPLSPTAEGDFAKAMQIGLADADGWTSGGPDPRWVISEPIVTRSQPIAASKDGGFSCGRWECRGGKFELTYCCDEFVQILEGSVTVDDGKQTRKLIPGDVAYFPQGLRATWTVHGYVKKFAIFRSMPYSPLRKLASKVKQFMTKLFR